MMVDGVVGRRYRSHNSAITPSTVLFSPRGQLYDFGIRIPVCWY